MAKLAQQGSHFPRRFPEEAMPCVLHDSQGGPVNSRGQQERVRRWHEEVVCAGDDERRGGNHAETSISIEALHGHEVSEAGRRWGRMAQGALRQHLAEVLLGLKKFQTKHHRPLSTHGLFPRHVWCTTYLACRSAGTAVIKVN